MSVLTDKIKIAVCGSNGKMGQEVIKAVKSAEDMELTAEIDIVNGQYSSIKEAADSNNIKTPANIIAAIKGTQKRCGGFRWRYFYGNTSNIKPL